MRTFTEAEVRAAVLGAVHAWNAQRSIWQDEASITASRAVEDIQYGVLNNLNI